MCFHITYTLLKKTVLWIAIVGLIGIGFCAIYIKRDRSFDLLPIIPARTTPNDWAEHIKIGVIGDSWVAGQKLDHAIQETMVASGIPAEVVSSGHPGANSRQIYRNLLNNDQSDPHSSNALLMDEDIDFLVVVAGVNDTVVHIGAEFYAHHMFCIIQTALDRGIKPIVVEVPEYGIEETPAVTLLSWARRTIYLWLFDYGKVDVIQEYRKKLRDTIPPAIANKVVFVAFSSIADNYHNTKNLYANPSHLNRDGNEKLGRLIANRIQDTHNE